ncbi:helicase [Corynebacterium ulcerans]|uniref:Helicase n=1 Tax=Corynebacterium ramonii TaxID=3026968 RepID=A0ABN4EGG4_9CORY|nr:MULTISPECIES: UvrD-helicase domain-containing protein [Corynebacterium]AIU32596.1 Helicase [Corynebacterium ramonii FRC0011]ESU58625.1 helicase [Corynebacterium ulcerans NCTC 12077]KKO87549.1 helicase [Corynebacterium ulcerans]STC75756.1 Helicase [Corynebacterium ulcerans]BDV25850.1 DNA helicase [Corynebacterium ulcerans]
MKTHIVEFYARNGKGCVLKSQQGAENSQRHDPRGSSNTTEPHASTPDNNQADAVIAEQGYVDKLFGKLDAEVLRANERLREVMLHVDPSNPDAEALVRRETEYHSLNQKIDRLNLAQLGLVFGRIDVYSESTDAIDNPVPGQPHVDRRYIGRMGLDDRDDDYRTLLLDWRAPLARPFYLATTANPENVCARRHIRTRGRTVTGVDDELLSGNQSAEATAASNVVSEAALYRAMHEARTGHMTSIVETIQREQDQIIRDETRGVMVVEGGPGTGKTAVALHRIAYLLYTWRDHLAKTGVLIIGPNRTFLDYISRVLPELGETGVVLSTVGDLYPTVSGHASEPILTREIKGSEEMVTILSRTVKNYQTVPQDSQEIIIDGNIELTVRPSLIKAARTRARRTRRPHNEAQPLFKEALVEQLTAVLAQKIGADPLGGVNLLSAADRAQLHDDLLDDPSVEKLVHTYWPALEPEQVLTALLEDPMVIAQSAFDYDEETQAALLRPAHSPWASSDAALLDELAVLLGIPDPETQRAEEDAQWRAQIEEAQDALEILTGSSNTDLDDESDAEILSAHDVIDAETLAKRQEVRDVRTTAQRAQEDHLWAYGHVIIDEAQELTPMEWRMVMRRSPSRWMTLVGDTSQTGSPAGVDSWADTLSPFVKHRFRTHHLTVNYRTPREIMDVANRVLACYSPESEPSTALRESGNPVHFLPLGSDSIAIARSLQESDPERLTAIIAADDATREGVLGVSDIKGLEFDHVIVEDPHHIIEASPQGWQDLFVSLTRATQSLTVIGELPI